ncbi:MAG: LptF/LptG family permease [Gemmatimonadota bacterium]
MRLSVLSRYLIRIHVGPFLFALCTITGLIFLNAVAQRVNDLVGKGLSGDVIFEFLLYSLPHTVALSLPMSILVAVLYAFSEMTSANEITAMAASGIRPTRVLGPLLVMGVLGTGVMLYFNDQVLPESNHALKNLLLDIGRKSPTLELREQVVNEIRTDEGSERYYITAARIDPGTNTLEDVTIFDGNDTRRNRTTYAARGRMAFNESQTDLFLTLYDGVVHEVQSERMGGFQRIYFDRQIVPLRSVGNELERRVGGSSRSDREMGFGLLHENASRRRVELDSIREVSRAQAVSLVRTAMALPLEEEADTLAAGTTRPRASTVGILARDRETQRMVMESRSRASVGASLQQSINRYDVEIHKKLAIAFACLVFTLIGPPLALRFPRGGVGMVVAASTLIFSVYWVGLIAGESLADRRIANPAVTMWMGNVVFLLVGLWLVRHMGDAGSTVRGGSGRLGALWERVTGRFRGRREAHAGGAAT